MARTIEEIMRDAGCIIVTDPIGSNPGAVGNGIADDTAAIQRAIDLGALYLRPVWFPSSKTYLISKPLLMIEYHPGSGGQQLYFRLLGGPVGSSPGAYRATIKLKSPSTIGNSLFSDPQNPCPMVYWSFGSPALSVRGEKVDLYKFGTGTAAEKRAAFRRATEAIHSARIQATLNPLVPSSETQFSWSDGKDYYLLSRGAMVMGGGFVNIDLDTNQNAGAIGANFALAQGTLVKDIKITATGSVCGFMGGCGRTSVARNIEVIGGEYAFCSSLGGWNARQESDGSAGTVYVGFKASGQTKAVIRATNEMYGFPVFVGFEFNVNGIPVFDTELNDARSPINDRDEFCMEDGKIINTGSSSTIMFNNGYGLTTYLRNVFITGSSKLLKTPTTTHTVTSSVWNRIKEYCHNTTRGVEYPTGGNLNAGIMETEYLIDGVYGSSSEPVPPIIEEDVTEPADFVSFHSRETGYYREDMVDITQFTYDGVNYSAKKDYSEDCAEIFHKAFLKAEEEGHNTVFVPLGTFKISSTVKLRDNTILIGVGNDVKSTIDMMKKATVTPDEAAETGGTSIDRYSKAELTNASRIIVDFNWLLNENEEKYMIETPNSPTANCQLVWLGINKGYFPTLRFNPETNETTYDNRIKQMHKCVKWQCSGENALMDCVQLHKMEQFEGKRTVGGVQYVVNDFIPLPQTNMDVLGYGGGRIYQVLPNHGDHYGHPDARHMLVYRTTAPLFLYGHQAELPKSKENFEDANIVFRQCKNVRNYGYKREGKGRSFLIEDSDNITLTGHLSAASTQCPTYFLMNGSTNNVSIRVINTKQDEFKYSGTFTQSGTTLTLNTNGRREYEVGDRVYVLIPSTQGKSTYGTVTSVTNSTVVLTSEFNNTSSGSYTIFGANVCRARLIEEIDGYPRRSIPWGKKMSYYKRGEPDDAAMGIPGWGGTVTPPPTRRISLDKSSVSPGDTITYVITSGTEAATKVLLNGKSLANTGSSSGGTITVPSRSDFLTGSFHTLSPTKPLKLEIVFPTESSHKADINFSGLGSNSGNHLSGIRTQ